jgi:hypothetical protein
MAVAVEMNFAGGTLSQYDTVVEKMGFKPGGRGAPGCMFHSVSKTDQGFRVTDIWETKEMYEQFAREKIGPITAQAGVTIRPEVTVRPVHNHLTAG